MNATCWYRISPLATFDRSVVGMDWLIIVDCVMVFTWPFMPYIFTCMSCSHFRLELHLQSYLSQLSTDTPHFWNHFIFDSFTFWWIIMPNLLGENKPRFCSTKTLLYSFSHYCFLFSCIQSNIDVWFVLWIAVCTRLHT